MELQSALTWGTTVSILLVVILSGPLVPMVDLTSEQGDDDAQARPANASVTVLEVPLEGYTIESQRYEADPGLYMPPAVVRIDNVTGDPVLVYKLAVPDVGVVAATVYFISETNENARLTLDTLPAAVDRNRISRDTYPGRVTLRVRGEFGARVIYAENVTVTVGDLDG